MFLFLMCLSTYLSIKTISNVITGMATTSLIARDASNTLNPFPIMNVSQ